MLAQALVWLLTLGGAQTVGPVASAPSVALFRINSEFGVPQGVANLLGERLASLLRESGSFKNVVASSDLEALVDLERQKQLADCNSESCVSEIAGFLGVDFLVVGTVGKLGGTYLLNLKLLNVRSASTPAAVSEQFPGDTEEALLNGTLPSLRKLLERAGFKHALPQTAENAPPTASTTSAAHAATEPGLGAAAAPKERAGWVLPVLGVAAVTALGGGALLLGGLLSGAVTFGFVVLNSRVFVDYPVELGKGQQRVTSLSVAYGALSAGSALLMVVGLGVLVLGAAGGAFAAPRL